MEKTNKGSRFTKYFHNSSSIFPSTILSQANPDALNEEELWKNCRNILKARAEGKSVEELWNFFRMILRSLERRGRIVEESSGRKIFMQLFPAALPDKGPPNLSTICPQFFHAGCLP
jgi:gentisate 1,2-dioxygenase